MRAVILLITCLLAPGLAYADPPASRAMPLDGEPGVWLRLDVARDALGCLDAREPTARRLRLLEADLAAHRDVELRLRQAYAAAGARAFSAERELRRPRRNPWIWLSTGLVLGLGGAVTAFVVAR
jgi:hypothetical protein